MANSQQSRRAILPGVNASKGWLVEVITAALRSSLRSEAAPKNYLHHSAQVGTMGDAQAPLPAVLAITAPS